MMQLLSRQLALLVFALLSAVVLADKPKVVYYYSQWAIWSRRYCADEFRTHFANTTHIQYSFHAPDKTCKIVTHDSEADYGGKEWCHYCEEQCTGNLGWNVNKEQSIERGNIGCLRKISKEMGIEIGISLGGWTLSTHFSDCVSSTDKRKIMIDSIIEQVTAIGWDFVDIDWEYPNGGGNDPDDASGSFGLPEDWDNFKLLVTELRAGLASEGMAHVGISGAFGQNPSLIEGYGRYTNPTPMKWLCDNLNYVSLMSYDLMGGWGAPTGWPAPLHHDPAATYDSAEKLTIEWQLKTWKAACGANFNKVVLGLPNYAKSWRSVPAGPTGTGMYESCTYTGQGPSGYEGLPCLGDGSFKDTAGTLETWDIEMNYLTDSRCKHYYNTVAKQDFVYCTGDGWYGANSPDNIWFAFDGPEVLYEKVKYAKEMGVGGYMFWEMAYAALGDTSMPALTNSKQIAYANHKAGAGDGYYWGPYEDACWAAWNGQPLATKSRGERIPDDSTGSGSDSGSGSSSGDAGSSSGDAGSSSGDAGSSSGDAGSISGGGKPNCDEVTSASATDGSVDAACMASFCSLACNTYMSGVCASSGDAASCLATQMSSIGVSCVFGA